ncbi:hypothetical protein ACIQWS_00310 [Phyllobacterium sp. NPDC097923]|uniref:hypothetical protein n=1 Tax=Phyllobacterium sp. NPDC097923 TaxID=3364404 RepID=UPI00383B38E6
MFGRIAGVLAIVILAATGSSRAEDAKPFDPNIAKAAQQIKMAVQRCWNRPEYKGPPLIVTLKVQLAKDGSIVGKPEILRPKKDKTFNSIAESAVRAIMRCAPFNTVPENPNLYEYLNKIEMSFHSPAH